MTNNHPEHFHLLLVALGAAFVGLLNVFLISFVIPGEPTLTDVMGMIGIPFGGAAVGLILRQCLLTRR